MKKTVGLTLVICLFFTLFGCFSDPESRTLYVPIDAEPVSLDPQIAFGYGDEIIVTNCMEGLLRINSGGAVDFGAATEYKVSADGLKYTFMLNPDARWHLTAEHKKVLGDGGFDNFDAAVKAEDFVFAFRRALSPETKAVYANKLYCVKNAKKVNEGTLAADKLGVKAVDERTLEITLDYADSSFLYTLASPVAMPCNQEFFELTKGKYGLDLDYILCNGPLYVTSWTHGSSVFIRVNKDYKGKAKVTASLIGLMVNKDPANRLKLLFTGSYDCDFVDAKAVSRLADTSPLNLKKLENRVWGLLINTETGCTKNADFRKALFYSFDKTLFEPPAYVGENTDLTVPRGCKIGNIAYSDFEYPKTKHIYSQEKAKNCLKRALDESEDGQASVSVTCCTDFRKSAEKAVQSWQSVLGVNLSVIINEVSDAELQSLLKKKAYEVAFVPLESDSSSADEYINKLCSVTIAHKSENLDSLISKMNKQTDAEKKAGTIAQIEDYLYTNAVFYPVFNGYTYFASYIKTEGIYYHASKNSLCLYSGERYE